MHSLSQEVNRFYKQQKQLRTIYSDTRTAFAEVQRTGFSSRSGLSLSGSFGSFSLSSGAFSCETKESTATGFAELSLSAERKLDLVTKSKLCFFITGDCAVEKLALVNEILGLPLMPVDALRELAGREGDDSATYKILNVKIGHSNKLSINFRVMDENVDLFELLETPTYPNNSSFSTSSEKNTGATPTPNVTVSLNDLSLRINETLQGGPPNNVKAKALLEIGVDAALLRYGTQIVMSSSFVTCGSTPASQPSESCATNGTTNDTGNIPDDYNVRIQAARARELSDDLRTLIGFVHSTSNEILSIFLHLTDGESLSLARTRSDLQELRTRHVNAVPIFVLHRSLFGISRKVASNLPSNGSSGESQHEQDPSVFDAPFANALTTVGFNVIDAQSDGGAMFDVMRLSDAAAASELLASFTDSLDDMGGGSQPNSNAVQPPVIATPARCDVMLIDRLCVAALSSIVSSARSGSRRNVLVPEPILTASGNGTGNGPSFIQVALQSCCVRAVSFGMKRLIVNGATQLCEAHRSTLQQFILTAFDMARDMQITPKRLAFVREKEQALFDALMALASRKQEEIRTLVADTIASMDRSMPSLIERAFGPSTEELPEFSEMPSESNRRASTELVRSETTKIRELVLARLNSEIAEQLVHSVNVLRESYTGTLARCVRSLETEGALPQQQQQQQQSNAAIETPPAPTSNWKPGGAESADEIDAETETEKNGQKENMTHSRSQSLPTIAEPNSTDTLKLAGMMQGRYGTPAATASSGAFVSSSSQANSASASAIDSLKRIIASIYSFDITLQASSSFVRALLERVKELLRAAPWNVPASVDSAWRISVAREMLASLSDARLARCVATQIRDRLRSSHEAFASALRSLEAKHSGRLERAETMRNDLRKRYTPRIARLLLEAISLRDVSLFGVPQHGRELGRGQYGVVYACESWANYGPCAVKSVVPPDERHWNDLALEFYYTRRIGEHERVVAIRGCVIDYSYLAVSGAGPAVLLVMDRLLRDLHQAIRLGIDWQARLQITIDVVEGLRYLHSQGLVHRDIKLKNVLLDKFNRAKITDLGFCKPEAMMSGSIVGTPIHMAPELFSGKYDASVDVYAFGILFWYICAGHVRLPSNLDQCTSKDMLWTSVRRGVRPERLPHFEDWCWQLMNACWVSDPSRRILLGDAEPMLRDKLEEERRRRSARRAERSSSKSTNRRSGSNSPVAHDRGEPRS